jgi:REP element-mobilizing transposase RayT
MKFRTWGGARAGAGRKRKGVRDCVSHRTRPTFAGRFPVHVTTRLRNGLPSLRRDVARRALERVFAAGSERFGFRLIHYSIQTNHFHLIVEASDRRALSRGMQGLLVRVVRALNSLWRRAGPVFSDRYHAHILRTPREVKHALAYVLHNARHHGIATRGIDPFTSGAAFDGWREGTRESIARARTVVPARTWLLGVGWRRHGLIGVDDPPRHGVGPPR